MRQYAVIGTHPPDICPMTNKAVREFATKAMAKLPELAQKKGVKVLMALHLDPNHKGFILFEAATAEAVRDLLFEGGFLHYVDLNFHLVTPLDELMQRAEQFPTLY